MNLNCYQQRSDKKAIEEQLSSTVHGDKDKWGPTNGQGMELLCMIRQTNCVSHALQQPVTFQYLNREWGKYGNPVL